MMIQQELHPFTLRVWHWTHTVLMILLILTGIKLRTPNLPLIISYAKAVTIHKYVGWAVSASFLFWFVHSTIKGSFWKHYFFRLRDLKGMMKQIRFYSFGVFTREQNPFHPTPKEKFNPLQKTAYLSIMLFFMPAIVVSGILFSDILLFRNAIQRIGGLRVLDAIHVIVAYLFVIYLIVHIYMSTLGKTIFSHIKEMVTGLQEEVETSTAEEE